MERYFVEEKDGIYAEVYCNNGKFVSDSGGAESMRPETAKLWSLCCAESVFIVLYSDSENRFFVSVIENGEIKNEKLLFKNGGLKNCLAAAVPYGLKIYSAEKKAEYYQISERTLSQQKVTINVLCCNAKRGRIKLFSSKEGTFFACETEKGIAVINCGNGERTEINEKTEDFSFFVKDGKIYCLSAAEKGVKLYCVYKNHIEKTDVFKGGCRECALAFLNGRIYASVKDTNKIYMRKCDSGDMKFSAMAQMPVGDETEKITIIGRNVLGEIFCTRDMTEFIKNLRKTKKREEKPQPEPKNDAVNDVLTANIKELTAHNSMLNMKINSMREVYREKISNMEKEISRLKKENDLCKRAQKILENEVFRLNNTKEEADEHKIIDNNEENC